MSNLDLFESVFKSALRNPFEYQAIEIKNILLITDLEESLPDFEGKMKAYLQHSLNLADKKWKSLGRSDYRQWAELKEIIDEFQPDLIVSYRLLRVRSRVQTSLGVYIDTLTQELDIPILVMPRPELRFYDRTNLDLKSVVIATEHHFEDHLLVNYGIYFTQRQGQLTLLHVEDEDTFNYYSKMIEKIPEINSQIAIDALRKKLLIAPMHYMKSVEAVLQEKREDLTIQKITDFGHLINYYKELTQKQKIDLLVFRTKDDTQLAMHSLGHSLLVEFKEIPAIMV
ncbi:MAG: hypothetical protein ACPGJS_03700 [Flammeovirgaceae bacterium]